LLTRLAVVGHEKCEELLEKERLKDPSDKGKKAAFMVEVSKLENKEKNWKSFVEGNTHSLDYLRNGMQGFYWRSQKDSLIKYIDLFFDNVKKIFLTKDRQYAEAFFSNLFPNLYITDETLQKGEKFLEQELSPLLKKDTLEALDEMKRSLKILKKFSS